MPHRQGFNFGLFAAAAAPRRERPGRRFGIEAGIGIRRAVASGEFVAYGFGWILGLMVWGGHGAPGSTRACERAARLKYARMVSTSRKHPSKINRVRPRGAGVCAWAALGGMAAGGADVLFPWHQGLAGGSVVAGAD